MGEQKAEDSFYFERLKISYLDWIWDCLKTLVSDDMESRQDPCSAVNSDMGMILCWELLALLIFC